jgi:hypothetical protein
LKIKWDYKRQDTYTSIAEQKHQHEGENGKRECCSSHGFVYAGKLKKTEDSENSFQSLM